MVLVAVSSREPTVVSPPHLSLDVFNLFCGCLVLRKIPLYLAAGVAAADQIKRKIPEQIPERAAGGGRETVSVSVCE